MKTVTVSASRTYDVKIGSGLLAAIGAEAAALGGASKVLIVSDCNVWPLYGNTVLKSLKNSCFEVYSHIIPAGEASKNGKNYLELINFLAESRLTRSDLIVSLGGGVVGDLSGFAAATYLRGIRYIQVPTTLMAAVDSSVGGKTAIDLSAGKNLCGAFWQPSLVLCDTDTLSSLPQEAFRDGCAEVIKYGIAFDSDFFDYLFDAGPDFDREAVIAHCVELKRAAVMADEFDTGIRKKLNLGHTLAHALEIRSNYALSHGKAVAIGIAMAARASKCVDTGRIIGCLEAFGLPTAADFPAEDLYSCALSDKKRSENTIDLVIPEGIGSCRIAATPVAELLTFIQEGM